MPDADKNFTTPATVPDFFTNENSLPEDRVAKGPLIPPDEDPEFQPVAAADDTPRRHRRHPRR